MIVILANSGTQLATINDSIIICFLIQFELIFPINYILYNSSSTLKVEPGLRMGLKAGTIGVS